MIPQRNISLIANALVAGGEYRTPLAARWAVWYGWQKQEATQ